MKYSNKINKYAAIFIIIICLCCPFVFVNARTLVDVDQKAEITIEYPVSNAEFSLYKVADVTKEYHFDVTEQFRKYSIDFNALDTEQWKDVADTLTGYVRRDKVEPLAVSVTDESGKLTFEDLYVGVYLVIGSKAQDGEFIYSCKPFLVFVPQETEDGAWNYELVAEPKFSDEPVKLLDISVIKIWKDQGLEEQRPETILIQLLKDGEIYDEIILNEENNWYHTWYDLSSEYTWNVVEKEVPEGYTVEITQEGTIFKVTNIKEGTPEIPDKLPQTGQIWWPVPILAMAGLLFLIAGLVRRRTNDMN